MPSSDIPGLRASDLATCRRMLRQGSRSFHAAARLLPRSVRDAVAPFYAFCRAADDLVDARSASGWTLVHLRDRVDAIYAGDAVAEPVDRALGAVVRHMGLPRPVFDTLLEGFAWEFDYPRYETLTDVKAYAVRVAGTVGVAVSCLMGQRGASTLARACDLGVAMQLTNIARDVGEDARAGRLYLPRDWMREAGIDPEAWLRSPVFAPAIGRVVEQILQAADALYRRADAGIPLLPRRCRLAIRAARLIYADIGREIARAGYDSVSRRAFTSGPRKAVLAWRAAVSRTGRPAVAAYEAPLPEAAALVAAVASNTDDEPPAAQADGSYAVLRPQEDSA